MLDCIGESKETLESFTSEKRKVIDVKREVIRNHVKGLNAVVEKLENNITESDREDQRFFKKLHVNHAKHENIVAQLEEARKENKQLLNILQQSCHDREASRSRLDVTSSCSTTSMVNLQYKYEELLENYKSLQELLSMKDRDICKLHKETECAKDKINALSNKLQSRKRLLNNICTNFNAFKQNMDIKVNQLKADKETLRITHEQLVNLLHQQCMEKDDIIMQQLQQTLKPDRAAFVHEVQRSNKLYHENLLLKQEIVYLKSNIIPYNSSVEELHP